MHRLLSPPRQAPVIPSPILCVPNRRAATTLRLDRLDTDVVQSIASVERVASRGTRSGVSAGRRFMCPWWQRVGVVAAAQASGAGTS